MNWNEMMSAVEDAERTMNNAREAARRVAKLLVGNLRHVSDGTLKQLKRELRDYNIHTASWKE